MSEQTVDPLKQALTQILTKATNGVEKGIDKATVAVEKGVDFLNAQLPEVIEQLLLWKMWESLLYCLGGIFLFIFLCAAPFVVYKILKKMNFAEWGEEFQVTTIIAGGIIGLIGWCLMFIKSLEMINFAWLQIWIALKIYLIEYAAGLFK